LDFNPVAEVGAARDAVSLAARLRPELTLVGAGLPDDPELDVVRELVEELPGAAIVVVADDLNPTQTAEALASGARGVISKQLDPDVFAAAVTTAMSMQVVLGSPFLAELVSSALPGAPDPALSRRELEILSLVARGRDNAAIAAQLHISPSTAKGHVSHILKKLETENRIQAAVQGVKRGLVRP
jgi:DNA-binding NarL/FixJ family response regulator